jgi:hypothetical protein
MIQYKRTRLRTCALPVICLGLIFISAGGAPIDPVVEEPLRPLLPDDAASPMLQPTSCGSPDIMPLAGLTFLGLNCRPRRSRRNRDRTT